MKEVRCRPARAEDFPFLAAMLGEAAVWRPDRPTPTADEVMTDPRYAMYLAGWPRHGDFGLVADQYGPLGAAWYRTYTEMSHGHGFVGEDVPELSIAVIASRRHQGIGRLLLIGLIEASEVQGYAALSLSVNHDNPARGLYESVGFQPVGQPRESALTMIRRAAQQADRPPAACSGSLAIEAIAVEPPLRTRQATPRHRSPSPPPDGSARAI